MLVLEKKVPGKLALDMQHEFFPQNASSFNIVGEFELAPWIRLVVRRSTEFHGRSLGITHNLEHGAHCIVVRHCAGSRRRYVRQTVAIPMTALPVATFAPAGRLEPAKLPLQRRASVTE
ncbi:MAG TPA: hypothetical protein VFS57_01015 [Gemmatimonadaceae bacterium]|nr:hypothetical protein [Gemmatimonadaceae bacterium]